MQAARLDQFAASLAAAGKRVLPGENGTFWVSGERGSLVRVPTFSTRPPASGEVHRVMLQGRSAVVSYLTEPDHEHPANATLYLCRNRSYSLEALNAKRRRDVRLAQRSFTIQPLDWPTLLDQGFPAFQETRQRVGLTDGTRESFLERFGRCPSNPAYHAIGAWKDGVLAAFMTVVAVDDWLEIGGYSTTDYLKFTPNNGLVHYVLEQIFINHPYTTVNYGLSTIQEDPTADGLHRFKLRVGFDAIPVHRAFVIHPLLRPLANPLTLWGLRSITRLRPRNRVLRKATGMLATYLGSSRELPGGTEIGNGD